MFVSIDDSFWTEWVVRGEGGGGGGGGGGFRGRTKVMLREKHRLDEVKKKTHHCLLNMLIGGRVWGISAGKKVANVQAL